MLEIHFLPERRSIPDSPASTNQRWGNWWRHDDRTTMEVVTCVRGGERYFFLVELAPTLNAVPAPVKQFVVLWYPRTTGNLLQTAVWDCSVYGDWQVTSDKRGCLSSFRLCGFVYTQCQIRENCLRLWRLKQRMVWHLATYWTWRFAVLQIRWWRSGHACTLGFCCCFWICNLVRENYPRYRTTDKTTPLSRLRRRPVCRLSITDIPSYLRGSEWQF